MPDGDISIVITTFNALDYLKLCVASLLENSRFSHQIVIYADGSAAATATYLKTLRAHPQITAHYEAQNVGISKALNRAARLARNRYLYFINDDMVFAPDWDDTLLRHMRPMRVLTGTVIEPERPNLHPAKCHVIHDFGLRADQFNRAEFDIKVLSLAENRVEAGINYPFLIERALFERIGGVDERFSGPVHDPDLFYRVALAGAEMLRVRDSLCYHFSGRSLRFEGEKETVSRAWIEAELDGKIAFLEKWGEKPRYHFGGVPSPGTNAPDAKLALTKRIAAALTARRYRRKAAKRLQNQP